MKIRARIGSKIIEGYWNGKYYKSRKDPEKNVRIYIDSVEYDIPKDKFDYEEILTEKQKKKAEKLKDTFIGRLKEALEKSPMNPSEETKQTIIKYFENQHIKYFLDNEIYLSNIISNAFARPHILASIIKQNPLESIKIVKAEIPEEKIKELLQRLFVKLIKTEPIIDPRESVIKIFEDDVNYYLFIKGRNSIFVVDKNNLKVKEKYGYDRVENLKSKAIIEIEKK